MFADSLDGIAGYTTSSCGISSASPCIFLLLSVEYSSRRPEREHGTVFPWFLSAWVTSVGRKRRSRTFHAISHSCLLSIRGPRLIPLCVSKSWRATLRRVPPTRACDGHVMLTPKGCCGHDVTAGCQQHFIKWTALSTRSFLLSFIPPPPPPPLWSEPPTLFSFS
jgi:hypothetical protein